MADDVLQADRIAFGICEFCAGVHVNFIGADGEVFATAVVPAADGGIFIDMFRAQLKALALRHAAPTRRQ